MGGQTLSEQSVWESEPTNVSLLWPAPVRGQLTCVASGWTAGSGGGQGGEQFEGVASPK